MSWIRNARFSPRPIAIVEDHVFHFEEILGAVERTEPAMLAQMTAVCLDRPGPDTNRSVLDWLERCPELQVAAVMDPSASADLPPDRRARLLRLQRDVFADNHRFCKAAAQLIRPGGLLVQDIQLDTLGFLPRDDWWASIYLANTIRGMFPQRSPFCRFMSNKRGFGIGFGKEMMEAGFDPREVIDKNELAKTIAPELALFLAQSFPLILEVCAGDEEPFERRISRDDRAAVEAELDLAWWADEEAGPALGGRLLAERSGKRAAMLRPKGQEAATWRLLLADFFDAGPGVAVDGVGRRLAPDGALKAERTNAAARHLHTLRGRLRDSDAILTAGHAYRLNRRLALGRVTAS